MKNMNVICTLAADMQDLKTLAMYFGAYGFVETKRSGTIK
jgi:hypothetical protein